MNTVIVIENMNEIEQGFDRALDSYVSQVVQATARAVDETSEEILDDSNNRAPVDTGNLVDSGHRDTPPAVVGNSAVAEVGYSAPYAAHVHEDLNLRKPKFLERAVMSVGPRLRENVIKEL